MKTGWIAAAALATATAAIGVVLLRPEPRKLGASGSMVWLVTSNRSQAGVLLAIARGIDSRLGYPLPTTWGDRFNTPADSTKWVQHATWPIQCAPGVYALPLGTVEAARYAISKAACASAVDAGGMPDGGAVPAACNVLVGMPSLIGDAAYASTCGAALVDAGGIASITCGDQPGGCDPPDDADGGAL